MTPDNFRRQVSVLVPAKTLKDFDELTRGESRSAAVTRLMLAALESEGGGEE